MKIEIEVTEAEIKDAIGAVSHLTHFINTVCERLEAAEREISAQNKQLAAKDEWIAAAISKLEAAEKDAARYHWLKDSASNWIRADVEIDKFMNHPHNLSYQQALVERDALRDALEEIADDYADRFDLESESTNPGIKYVIAQARSALAKVKEE